MYPNNEQPVDPSNYLDQIAPQRKRAGLDIFRQKPSRLLFMGLGAAFVIVIILSIIVGALTGNDSKLEHLAARLDSTQKTSISASANVKSTQLRALNSSLQLYLTNTIRDATPIFEKNNIKMTKLSKKIIAAESNSKILSVLEDARLNAIYDRTYAREMAYQLDTLITLMKQIYNETTNTSLKTFLSTAYKSLEPTHKQFADYFAANS